MHVCERNEPDRGEGMSERDQRYVYSAVCTWYGSIHEVGGTVGKIVLGTVGTVGKEGQR